MFRRIFSGEIPALRGTLMVAALLGAVLSFGELGASLMLAPPGWTPLTSRIFELSHYGYSADVNGMALLLVVTALGIAGIAWTGRKGLGLLAGERGNSR